MASPDAALRKFACGRKGESARTGNGGASSRANFALQANHFARRNLFNLPVSASDASLEEDEASPDTVLRGTFACGGLAEGVLTTGDPDLT